MKKDFDYFQNVCEDFEYERSQRIQALIDVNREMINTFTKFLNDEVITDELKQYLY